MRRVLSTKEMREVDAVASKRFGILVSSLMENAGTALAEAALQLAGPESRFWVFCGSGHNGGDGLVAARKLNEWGRKVNVSLQGAPELARQALVDAGVKPVPIAEGFSGTPGDVVIDALLGTGLSRPVEGSLAQVVERIAAFRDAGCRVLSADLPSGLRSEWAEPGERGDCVVQADRTVAFGFPKLATVVEPGASWSGALEVADIGIPAAALSVVQGPATYWIEESDGRERLPERRADTHKGSYGHLLTIAGSRGRSGAAALAAQAALRSGVGKVTVACRDDALDAVLAHAPEMMGLPLSGQGPLSLKDREALRDATRGMDALVVGPGIPRGPETGSLLLGLLQENEAPCVLDADALNAIADTPGGVKALSRLKAQVLLTPHPGEMARLAGITPSAVQADRLGLARRFASEHRVTLVLKGARTLIALPDGTLFVNPTGNPGMATAGAGDVLSGILGALLAQGLEPVDAAIAGVYAHGLAGDLAAKRRGQLGLTASEISRALGEVWVRWSR